MTVTLLMDVKGAAKLSAQTAPIKYTTTAEAANDWIIKCALVARREAVGV